MNPPEGLRARALRIVHPTFSATYDLEVPAGAFCALIGPSGGGKTTLINAIAGFETPASGALEFAGRDLLPLAPAARPVTILFQDDNLFGRLTVWSNVAIGVDPGLRLDDASRARVAAALERVGLADKADRLPSGLSGGERQRVGLARALARARPLLLLDEPFGALDPGLRRDMIAEVDAIRLSAGATVLLSLHTPRDMLGHADMAAFVAGGAIARLGTPRELLAGGDPVLDDYLGRRPADPRLH